ncbi:11466_t:CDS:1, partial [Dentiscutata erythropus]
DKNFSWNYLRISYENKPCSLNRFELRLFDDSFTKNYYSCSKVLKNGTESFLFPLRNAKLYFNEIEITEFTVNQYKIKDYFDENNKLYIYLTLGNEIIDLDERYICKFISSEIDFESNFDKKNIDYNNEYFLNIEQQEINSRFYFELNQDEKYTG